MGWVVGTRPIASYAGYLDAQRAREKTKGTQMTPDIRPIRHSTVQQIPEVQQVPGGLTDLVACTPRCICICARHCWWIAALYSFVSRLRLEVSACLCFTCHTMETWNYASSKRLTAVPSICNSSACCSHLL